MCRHGAPHVRARGNYVLFGAQDAEHATRRPRVIVGKPANVVQNRSCLTVKFCQAMTEFHGEVGLL
jgi:hypothetical protein